MKTLITWIVILLVIIGGIYWATHRSNGTATPNQYTQTVDNANGPDYMPGTNTTSSTTSTPQTITVIYTDSGFSPKSVTIKKGDTVKFVNNSSGKMWVASAQHPTHTVYDGTNLQTHCAAGATPSFDECKAESAGATYSFTFDKVGTWGYHNHSRSSDYGSIIVQ